MKATGQLYTCRQRPQILYNHYTILLNRKNKNDKGALYEDQKNKKIRNGTDIHNTQKKKYIHDR